MTPQEILSNAADLLENKGWCQRSFATTNKGNPIYWDNPNATCFCAIGAIRRAAGSVSTAGDAGCQVSTALNSVENHIGKVITLWNDDHQTTKEEVIQTLREVSKTLG